LQMNAQRIVAGAGVRGAVLQRKCACGQHNGGGECAECSKKRRGHAAAQSVGGVLQRRNAGIDTATRSFFEPRFGFDFSQLPVHGSDERAEVHNGSDPDEGNKQSPQQGGKQAKNAPACTAPSGVRLVSSPEVEFPGYLTGGGICALMRLLPESGDVCHVNVIEELSTTKGTTCPNSLLQPSLCYGKSEFTPGKRPTKGPCKSLDLKPTDFPDRHTVELSGTSILHDSKRNPKGLNACKIVCDQEYYIPGRDRVSLGHFLIQTDLRKATVDEKKVTLATVSKKAKS
jgi:hypothetical protein